MSVKHALTDHTCIHKDDIKIKLDTLCTDSNHGFNSYTIFAKTQAKAKR